MGNMKSDWAPEVLKAHTLLSSQAFSHIMEIPT